MPYPAQIDRESIVETAYELIEAQGFDTVSLRMVADALGVKAPSLYRHIKNKAALLKAVNEMTNQRMFDVLGELLETAPSAIAQLQAGASALREFAHQHPTTYVLAFTTRDPEARPDANEQEQAILPFQALMADVAGEANSLPALRGFLALVHGFVMLELNDQLRRGGDLDDAFEQSVMAYLRGWS